MKLIIIIITLWQSMVLPKFVEQFRYFLQFKTIISDKKDMIAAITRL